VQSPSEVPLDLAPMVENYSMAAMHAYAIYPATRYMPLKVKIHIDFLIDRFRDALYGIAYNLDALWLGSLVL
jgi:hypothetical protein